MADTFNGLIRRIDLKTNTVATWLGSATDDPRAVNSFYEPGGVCVAGDTLYVADTNHHRIVAIDIPSKKARVVIIELPNR
jgi:sugar lactone lactonase YvrE